MCVLFQPDYSVNQKGHQKLHCKCVLVFRKYSILRNDINDIVIEYYRLVTGDSPEAYEERPDWAKASKYNNI